MDSQGGDEGGCIVPAREKSSWRELGGNVAFGDGVCSFHSGDAATDRSNGNNAIDKATAEKASTAETAAATMSPK